jgi:DNA (cytosine-5)-methyltransferase 1
MPVRTSKSKKIQRVRSGEPFRVIDLFSGCGGLSLGFCKSGFRIAASVEIDPLAAASHYLNFHGPLEDREPVDLAKDITKIEPADLVAEFSPGVAVEDAVDVLIGGPPCQAFARVGRMKLRFKLTVGNFAAGLPGPWSRIAPGC